jgi:hypothetical protein
MITVVTYAHSKIRNRGILQTEWKYAQCGLVLKWKYQIKVTFMAVIYN